MIKIIKIIYTVLTLVEVLVTGNNTLVLRSIGNKVERMTIPQVTSHSQININLSARSRNFLDLVLL